MKKLLFISSNQYPPLSQDHNTKKKWVELAKACDEYHIIARSKDNRFHHYKEDNLFLHLVPKLGNKSRSIYLSGFYYFYLVWKIKPGILLVQSAILGGLYATWASKIFAIPMMVEIHGEEYFRYLNMEKWWYFPLRKMIKYVYGNATKLRSLNKMMTKKLAEHNIIKNVVEIPNRVDLKVFNEQKSDFSIQMPLKLISVGRFVPAKNYDKLIEKLARSKIEFHLTLIGGGPLEQKYLDIIKKYSIREKVELIDWISQTELIEKLIQSDIYIQYSKSEGMPRTILEAMSLRLPVLSTPAGSIEGIIDHNRNGYIIALNDEKELYDSLQSLIKDQTLREHLAHTAYHDVLEKYEWNLVFNFYRKILSNLFAIENPKKSKVHG